MSETATEQKKSTKNKISEPKKFKVIFLNDDKTPMEFVVDVLVNLFGHDDETSKNLTLKIHIEGSAVVGIYPFEIAEQKGLETTQLARSAGYPLVVKIESE
jgi:ATP-dependent Clp protease adaptor protein ClpS